MVRKFDLNIEKVLEHWAAPHALREIIANALDEQALTGSREPQVFQDEIGAWHIRDWGRGLRYDHLTQNENREKLRNPNLVIGKFGVGLKDALAAFDRRKIQVTIDSRFGRITTGKDAKHGFEDVSTLHALIENTRHPQMVGTDVILSGIRDEDVETAKGFFLRYSGDELLERTQNGDVLRRPEGRGRSARIYVNGLRVADEENFLFSYNISSPTKQLLKELNRERSNVGRSAYTDRVKDILLACTSRPVVERLAADLSNLDSGSAHDELQWINVATHACQVLSTLERVIFVTGMEAVECPTVIDRARNDGLRVVIVPMTVRMKLPGLLDASDQPVRDLSQYLREWDQSFHYTFVDEKDLTDAELVVWEQMPANLKLAGGRSKVVKEIRISETMRLQGDRYSEAVGVWDEREGQIVIKRDQLARSQLFAGTLLHEVVHAKTDGADDLTTEFVDGLTSMLGRIAVKGL